MTNDENKLRQALAKDADKRAEEYSNHPDNYLAHQEIVDGKHSEDVILRWSRADFLEGAASRDDLICALVQVLKKIGHRSEPEDVLDMNEILGYLKCAEDVIADANEVLAKLYKELDVKS